MANDDIVQVISDAREDAVSLSHFMYYPATDTVNRRLAPPIHTLNYYLQYLEGLEKVYSQPTGTVEVNGAVVKTVRQSINDAVDSVILGDYQAQLEVELDSEVTRANNREDEIEDALEAEVIRATEAEGAVSQGLSDLSLEVDAQKLDTGIIATAKSGGVERSQAEKNSDYTTLKDFGGTGADDTFALKAALSANVKELNLNTLSSQIKQVNIKQDINLHGGAELTQPQGDSHLLYSMNDIDTPEYTNGEYVKGFSAVGLKFGEMGFSTSDDFAAVALFETDGMVSAMNTYTKVASGLRISSAPTKFGIPNYGSRDTLVLGDRFIETDRFAVQNLQSQYTRMVGIARHSDRDNTYTPEGGLNNGGFNGGIRLAGQSVGNILAASNIRDSWTAVELQKGCNYNVLSGNYYENTYSNTINVSNTTNGNSAHNNHIGFVIKDAGGAGIRARYSSANRFNGSVIGTGKSVAQSGEGIDLRNSSGTATKHYRIKYNNGSGVVPAVGTTITQGTASATLVSVDEYGIKVIAAGAAMPVDGELYVKDLTGDFFKAGELAGVSATATRCYAADGRHRVDMTIADPRQSHAFIGSDCNLVDLIILDGSATSVNIEGSYNNVRIVVADNVAGYKVEVSGNYNIVTVTDNNLKSNVTTRINGGNNHVTVATGEGSLLVAGNNNTTGGSCNTLLITGNKNIVMGSCKVLSAITGTLNNTKSLIGASQTISFAGSTDGTGKINIDHDLLRAAASADISINGATPYIITLSSPAVTAKRAQLSVFKTDGTPALNTSVSLTIDLTI